MNNLSFSKRINGHIKHNDEISIVKRKIQLIKSFIIIVLSIGLIIFLTIYNLNNRNVNIYTKNEEYLQVPPFFILFENNYSIFMPTIKINIRNAKNLTELYGCTGTGTNSEICVYKIKDSVTIVDNKDGGPIKVDVQSNELIKLKEDESLQLIIGFYNFNGTVNQNFNIQTCLYKNDLCLVSDRTQSQSIGFVKSTTILSNGTQDDKYMFTMSSGNSIILDGLSIFEYTFYFSTNDVLYETLDSDSTVTIKTLANIGSFIGIMLTVVTIVFSKITKLFIKDKSGWWDYDIHQCIVYNFDKIGNKSVELKSTSISTTISQQP